MPTINRPMSRINDMTSSFSAFGSTVKHPQWMSNPLNRADDNAIIKTKINRLKIIRLARSNNPMIKKTPVISSSQGTKMATE